MTEPSVEAPLPPLYEGHGLPVEKLDPGKFEGFVFACLVSVAEVLGFKVTGKPSGSGDGGFDVVGESLRTSRKVCVQCKRQQKSLGSSQVAFELAKVAGNSKLEGSDVGEHRFICTGGVTQSLESLLRQGFRQELAAEAGRLMATAQDGELATLRQKLHTAGHDARQVAESYVQNLDQLLAWSFHEFDVAISSRWDAILPSLIGTFTLQRSCGNSRGLNSIAAPTWLNTSHSISQRILVCSPGCFRLGFPAPRQRTLPPLNPLLHEVSRV